MSTGMTVLIVAVVVIVIAVVVALIVRSKKQQQQQSSVHMGLPDLGALSTEGLDKAHAAGPIDSTQTDAIQTEQSTQEASDPAHRRS